MAKHLAPAYLNAESFITSVWICFFRSSIKKKKISNVEHWNKLYFVLQWC